MFNLFPFLVSGEGGEGLRDLIQIKGPRVPGFFFAYPLAHVVPRETPLATLPAILPAVLKPLGSQLSRSCGNLLPSLTTPVFIILGSYALR